MLLHSFQSPIARKLVRTKRAPLRGLLFRPSPRSQPMVNQSLPLSRCDLAHGPHCPCRKCWPDGRDRQGLRRPRAAVFLRAHLGPNRPRRLEVRREGRTSPLSPVSSRKSGVGSAKASRLAIDVSPSSSRPRTQAGLIASRATVAFPIVAVSLSSFLRFDCLTYVLTGQGL
jgi:hypothetical protein